MIKIDFFDIIPDSLKQKALDVLVDFGAEQLKKILGDEVAEKFKQLRSDAEFKREFEQGLQRAVQRFVSEYHVIDEELATAIVSGYGFFEDREVQGILLEIVKRPGTYLSDERETLVESFGTVLPMLQDRERVNRAVHHLLKCLAQELMHLPELQPVYSVHFQRITAEAVSEMRRLQEIQLRTQLSVSTDIRDILFQLTDALAKQKLLQAGTEFSLPEIPQEYEVLHNLPQPNYGQFVGRKEELDIVFSIMRPYPQSREHLVSVDGIGGVGKTTLALEVAYNYVRNFYSIPVDERFEAIIWVSAKPTLLTADGIIQRPEAFRGLQDIYDVIALTLRREDITRAPAEEKGQLINKLLHHQRTLLIVDNFDTVDDDRVTAFLRDLIAPTKAIVTTRHRIDVAYPVRLVAMPWDEARVLITQECVRRNVSLTENESFELYKRTGGVPLALVWSVAKIGFGYSIASVIERLGQPTNDIVRFCFEGVIESIRDKPAHKLIVSLSLFSSDASREALGYVSGYEQATLIRDEGLVDLEKLALVNKDKARFVLPALVKEHILPGLPSNSQFVTEAQNRFRGFYLQKLSSLFGSNYWDSYLAWRNYYFLDIELSNIRLLFERSTLQRDWKGLIAIFTAIVHYLSRKSQWDLRLQLGLQAIIAAQESNDPLLECWYHIDSLGWIYLQQGKFDLVLQHVDIGESIARRIGAVDVLAHAAAHRSQVLANQGKWPQARDTLAPFLSQSILLAPIVRRHLLTYWADQRRVEGDIEDAKKALEDAKSLCSEINDDAGLSYVLLVLAEIKLSEGEYDLASELFRQILDFETQLDRSGVVGRAQLGLAKLAFNAKNSLEVVSYAQQATERFHRVGMETEELEALEYIEKGRSLV